MQTTSQTILLWREQLERQNGEILTALINQNQQAAESTLNGLDNYFTFGDFGGDCSCEVYSRWN